MFLHEYADVPRGTYQIMRIILFFTFILLALSGCKKPDPNPELHDPIYSDLQSRLGSVSSSLNAEKKTLAEHQKTLSEVKPQTGQNKYAMKRVYESQEKITRFQQEEQYLTLKIAARKKQAKRSYMAAFNKGESWPDPAEYQAYQSEQRLRNAKRSWDVKERMKSAGISEKPHAPASAEHEAPPPAGH